MSKGAWVVVRLLLTLHPSLITHHRSYQPPALAAPAFAIARLAVLEVELLGLLERQDVHADMNILAEASGHLTPSMISGPLGRLPGHDMGKAPVAGSQVDRDPTPEGGQAVCKLLVRAFEALAAHEVHTLPVSHACGHP